jgi:transposase-like protein
MFEPMALALIKDQQQQLEQLDFVYKHGLTTSQTSSLIKKIYGKQYYKNAISNTTSSFLYQMEQWTTVAKLYRLFSNIKSTKN